MYSTLANYVTLVTLSDYRVTARFTGVLFYGEQLNGTTSYQSGTYPDDTPGTLPPVTAADVHHAITSQEIVIIKEFLPVFDGRTKKWKERSSTFR